MQERIKDKTQLLVKMQKHLNFLRSPILLVPAKAILPHTCSGVAEWQLEGRSERLILIVIKSKRGFNIQNTVSGAITELPSLRATLVK